jgi:hypothetical protein
LLTVADLFSTLQLAEDLFKQLLPLMDQLDEDTADEAEAVHNALGMDHVVG